MRIQKYIIFALLLTAIIPEMRAQAKKADETTINSVWYNARRGVPSAMNQLGVWFYSGNNVEKDYQKAYQWWSKAALQQNAKAIANLGVCYQYGRGAERDSIAAIRLYVTSVGLGQHELLEQRVKNTPHNIFDDMLVATCYENGVGVPQDFAKAAELYGAAAERGSVDGMLNAAHALKMMGDVKGALAYYDQAAQAGSGEGAFRAAKIRLNNPGNATGRSKAIADIQKANDAGIEGAATELGKYYMGLTADGAGKDDRQALNTLQKAAQSGDAEGMWYYGVALKNAENYDDAMFWMSMAVDAGANDQFQRYFNELSTNDPYRRYLIAMRRYIVEKNYSAAMNEFKALDKDGSLAGKVMYNVVLADKSNPDSNPKKAAKALDKLAVESATAAIALAGLYNTGYGVTLNHNKQISLLRHAANAGNGEAQSILGDIYFDGRIASPDRRAAADLYKKAYKQRRLGSDGAVRLMSMYDTGSFGVAKDTDMADRLGKYNPPADLSQMLLLTQ